MKVICNKDVCHKQCGAKRPHDDSCCEPCPFYGDKVKCVCAVCKGVGEVTTFSTDRLPEPENKPCPECTGIDIVTP